METAVLKIKRQKTGDARPTWKPNVQRAAAARSRLTWDILASLSLPVLSLSGTFFIH